MISIAGIWEAQSNRSIRKDRIYLLMFQNLE